MSPCVRFEGFEVDPAAGRLLKHGARIHLREQPLQVLLALLERPGEVVTREEIRRRLWPADINVDFENNLNTAVGRLREALGDSAEHPRFVETLPKRGYRFIAAVSTAGDATGDVGPPRVRLLVLPFLNLTGDPAQDYLADAMTDEVITALSALAQESLAVIARTTAMRYKGSNKDVAAIGRELKVDRLVEGAIRRAGESVTVNVQLVRAGDQAQAWAKRYDTTSASLFDVPDLVAPAVAAALGVGPSSADRIAGRAPAMKWAARDPVAYGECARGLHDLDRTTHFQKSLRSARAHFETALARDPDYAPAHEGLARLYWTAGYAGVMSPHEAVAAGMPHAVRTLELDETGAEARALMAHYCKQLDYNWPDIGRELRGALDLNPGSSLVRMLHAIGWLMPQGHVTEAVAEMERAVERDPLSFQCQYWLGIMLTLARDWDHAVAHAGVLEGMEPGSPMGPFVKAAGLRAQGHRDEALAAARRAVELSGGSAMMLAWLGLHLGMLGPTDETRALLVRLSDMAHTQYVPPCCFAWTYLGLREVDTAFEWLDRAVEARDQFMMPIKSYAFFDPIRADARFTALLRKMKLEP